MKKKLALRARVKRDGKWNSLPARELVPGDLIRLRIGEIVPADAKLAGEDSLEVDQSALTGESLPVTREVGDVVYSGAIVRRGETEAFVYATGTSTYFGKTAQLVEEAVSTSHFQKAVLKIGDFLILLAVGLGGIDPGSCPVPRRSYDDNRSICPRTDSSGNSRSLADSTLSNHGGWGKASFEVAGDRQPPGID